MSQRMKCGRRENDESEKTASARRHTCLFVYEGRCASIGGFVLFCRIGERFFAFFENQQEITTVTVIWASSRGWRVPRRQLDRLGGHRHLARDEVKTVGDPLRWDRTLP